MTETKPFLTCSSVFSDYLCSLKDAHGRGLGGGCPLSEWKERNGCVFVAVLITHRGLDRGKSLLWAAGRKFCISKENPPCECVLLVPCLLSFEESGIISRIYSCKWTAVQCPFQPSRTRKLETTAYGCVRRPEPAFASLIPLIRPVLVPTIFVIRYCLCVFSHLKQPWWWTRPSSSYLHHTGRLQSTHQTLRTEVTGSPPWCHFLLPSLLPPVWSLLCNLSPHYSLTLLFVACWGWFCCTDGLGFSQGRWHLSHFPLWLTQSPLDHVEQTQQNFSSF